MGMSALRCGGTRIKMNFKEQEEGLKGPEGMHQIKMHDTRNFLNKAGQFILKFASFSGYVPEYQITVDANADDNVKIDKERYEIKDRYFTIGLFGGITTLGANFFLDKILGGALIGASMSGTETRMQHGLIGRYKPMEKAQEKSDEIAKELLVANTKKDGLEKQLASREKNDGKKAAIGFAKKAARKYERNNAKKAERETISLEKEIEKQNKKIAKLETKQNKADAKLEAKTATYNAYKGKFFTYINTKYGSGEEGTAPTKPSPKKYKDVDPLKAFDEKRTPKKHKPKKDKSVES